MVARDVICSGCGQKVELAEKEPPCKALDGWITLSHWKGLGSVEHYNFCSLTCLKNWAESQAPAIPKVFLESFSEESGEENAS